MKQSYCIRCLLLVVLIWTNGAIAGVKVEFCNEGTTSFRWAYIAHDGGVFGRSTSMEDAVDIWASGFSYAPAGQCRTTRSEIHGDEIYFVFLTTGEDIQYFQLTWNGARIEQDEHPIDEVCVPLDGYVFRYSVDPANYKDGKVVRCPDKIGSYGRLESDDPREMGIAKVSGGIRVEGDVFLTITIPRLYDLAEYSLRREGEEGPATPVVKIASLEEQVVLKKRVRSAYVEYSEPCNVVSRLSLEDYGIVTDKDLAVYTMDRLGNMEVQLDRGGNTIKVPAGSFYDILSEGRFSLYRVVTRSQSLHNTQHAGYFVEAEFATWGGFYLDKSAVDLEKVRLEWCKNNLT